MAIPPEPLAELLAQATSVVIAEVTAIVKVGALPKKKEKTHPSMVDVGNKKPAQTVKLKVTRTLKGMSATEPSVEKPEAAYSLAVGDKGAFFLANGAIIGRYGPNTYPLERIESALTKG